MRTIDQVSIKEAGQILDTLREELTCSFLRRFTDENNIHPKLCSQLASQVFLELLTVFAADKIIVDPRGPLDHMIRGTQ